MIVMRFMMMMAAMTTMMAGPRTVDLGSFSPVQQLDEPNEASSYQVQALDLGSCSLLPCYIIRYSEYRKTSCVWCQKLRWVYTFLSNPQTPLP